MGYLDHVYKCTFPSFFESVYTDMPLLAQVDSEGRHGEGTDWIPAVEEGSARGGDTASKECSHHTSKECRHHSCSLV